MEINGYTFELTQALAVWGALLSTILFSLKIYDAWNARFQIEVSSILRGCAELGHDVSIKNISSKPVLLEYMQLYSKKSILPFSKQNYIWSPEDSWLNVRIEPYNTKVYNFSEGDYFGWSGRTVYVQLHFAGRKPLVKKLKC